MFFNKRPKKILAIASEGGHWVQLMRLKPIFDKNNTIYASTNYGIKVAYDLTDLSLVRDANLNKKFALFILAWDVLKIILKERPTHVVSTGAAPGFFAIVFGKLFGAKTIWIDSIANAEELSVTGKYVKYFSNHWLTQWPELETPNGPKFVGRVL